VRAVLEGARRGARLVSGAVCVCASGASSETLVPLETCGRVARDGLLGGGAENQRLWTRRGREASGTGEDLTISRGGRPSGYSWAAGSGMFWVVDFARGLPGDQAEGADGGGWVRPARQAPFFEGFPLWAGDKDDPVEMGGRNGRATEGEIVCLVVDTGGDDDDDFLVLSEPRALI
jgi:hypothetical protein